MIRLAPITFAITCFLLAAPASAGGLLESLFGLYDAPAKSTSTNPDNRINYFVGGKKGSRAFPWNTPMPKDKADRIKQLLETRFVQQRNIEEYRALTHRYLNKDQKAYRQQKKQGPVVWKVSGQRIIENLDIGKMITETNTIKKQVSQTVRHNDGRQRAIIHRKKSTLFVTKWVSPKGVPLKHTVKVNADGTWAYQTTNRAQKRVVDSGHGRKGIYSKMRSSKARRDWVLFRKH